MTTPKNIFLICPVRGATDAETAAIEQYVAELERANHKVHWPKRDTPQDDSIGITICRTNFRALMNADEVRVWYVDASSGSKFDFGGLFMLEMLGRHKNVVIANQESAAAEDDEKYGKQKSFFKVLRQLEEQSANTHN